MTHPASALIRNNLIPSAPISVRRLDGTPFWETDQAEINRMIKAGVVEGVGPSSGRIARLRMICDEAEALRRTTELRMAEPRIEADNSSAPRNDIGVYRQSISSAGPDGGILFSATVYTFKPIHRRCDCGAGLRGPWERKVGACGNCQRRNKAA